MEIKHFKEYEKKIISPEIKEDDMQDFSKKKNKGTKKPDLIPMPNKGPKTKKPKGGK